MRESFPLSGWLIIGLLIAVTVFLLAGPQSQAASTSFTLTETPIGTWNDVVNDYGRWTYVASANQAPGAFNRWQDSPWHWRHYDPTDPGREHIKCDDIQYLFPADPNSLDTAVSADGQTVTVNIYQAKDSVYVCFALECDDGSYSFVLMRNLQTEETITSGPCGGGSNNLINQPNHPAIDQTESDDDKLDPANNVDPIDDSNGQGEEGPGGNDQNDQGQDNGQDDNQRNDQGQGNDQNDQGQDNGQDDQNQDNGQGNDQNDQGQNQDGSNQPDGEGQTNQPPTTEDPPIDKTPSK